MSTEWPINPPRKKGAIPMRRHPAVKDDKPERDRLEEIEEKLDRVFAVAVTTLVVLTGILFVLLVF